MTFRRLALQSPAMKRRPWLVLMTASLVLLGVPRVGAADEVQEQLHLLLNGRPGQVDQAIERLRYLGPGRAGGALRALLKSPSTSARIRASDALVRVIDPGSAHALAEALATDEDWEVRRNCADALGALVAKSQRKALEKALRVDTNRRVRKSSALALGRVGSAGSALAHAAAVDPDLEVRLAALDALSRAFDKSAVTPARKLLTDSSSMVRFGAARALAWNGDAAGRRFLEQALASDDEEGSRRAVVVLADLPKPWASDILLSASAQDSERGIESARALARRDDERGLRALLRIEQAGGELGDAATAALDDLGIEEARRVSLRQGQP